MRTRLVRPVSSAPRRLGPSRRIQGRARAAHDERLLRLRCGEHALPAGVVVADERHHVRAALAFDLALLGSLRSSSFAAPIPAGARLGGFGCARGADDGARRGELRRSACRDGVPQSLRAIPVEAGERTRTLPASRTSAASGIYLTRWPDLFARRMPGRRQGRGRPLRRTRVRWDVRQARDCPRSGEGAPRGWLYGTGDTPIVPIRRPIPLRICPQGLGGAHVRDRARGLSALPAAGPTP